MSALASVPPALGLVGHHTDCGVNKGGLGVVECPGRAAENRVLRDGRDVFSPRIRQSTPPRS